MEREEAVATATKEQEEVQLHLDVKDSLVRLDVLILEARHQVDWEIAKAGDGDMEYAAKILQRALQWLGYLEDAEHELEPLVYAPMRRRAWEEIETAKRHPARLFDRAEKQLQRVRDERPV